MWSSADICLDSKGKSSTRLQAIYCIFLLTLICNPDLSIRNDFLKLIEKDSKRKWCVVNLLRSNYRIEFEPVRVKHTLSVIGEICIREMSGQEALQQLADTMVA